MLTLLNSFRFRNLPSLDHQKTNVMNNLLLSLICFVLAFAKAETAQAQQDFKGVATYQSKMIFKEKEKDGDNEEEAKANSKMSPEMQAAMKKALESAGQAEFTLSFTKDESLYEKVEELAKPKPSSGITIQITGGGGTYGTTYKNLKEGIFKREDQIMTKEFLITDELEEFNWEVTGETKQIGNYMAIKAVLKPKPKTEEELAEEKKKEEEAKKKEENGENDGLLNMIEVEVKETTAWFTPQIPVSNGPGKYHGLPGLILELNEGNTVILCSKIELNPEKFELKEPKTGKKIGLEEFRELRDKKQKEQMERFKNKKGGGVFFGG